VHQRERALNLSDSTECECGISAKVSIERASYVPGQFTNSIAPCPLSIPRYFSHILSFQKAYGQTLALIHTYISRDIFPW